MNKIILMSLLTSFAVSAGADSLMVLNADFQESAGTVDNWDVTISGDPKDPIYAWAHGDDTSLAYKDSVGPFFVEQNLSTNNYGLVAETSGDWTVGFDYGWRSNFEGGDAEFVVSVMDLATDAVLASTNLIIAVTDPTINDTYTLTGTANFSLGYDTNAVTAGNPVKLRIERIDPYDVSDANWANGRSTAFIDNITVVVAGYTYEVPPPPPPPEPSDDLIILNADFQGSTGNVADWDVTESTGDPIYAWAHGDDTSLAYKDSDGPSYIQQNLSTNNTDLTTESRGEWTVGFKYGWRSNTAGGDAEFTVSLIDLDTDTVLSSAIQTVVLTDPTIYNSYTNMGTASLTLDYDNETAPVGHSIALRIERTDANDGASSGSTAFIDDVTVVALIPSPHVNATILSITSTDNDIMKIVINAPSNPEDYQIITKGNLIINGWTNAAHSIDGLAPWIVSNLTYVTEFESGTNPVIYVQASEDMKFFGISD